MPHRPYKEVSLSIHTHTFLTRKSLGIPPFVAAPLFEAITAALLAAFWSLLTVTMGPAVGRPLVAAACALAARLWPSLLSSLYWEDLSSLSCLCVCVCVCVCACVCVCTTVIYLALGFHLLRVQRGSESIKKPTHTVIFAMVKNNKLQSLL